MNKKRQFNVPGIYHPLKVKIVTKKWLSAHLKDNVIMGAYVHEDGVIYVVKELTFHVRIHTFWHEVGHHIDETLKAVKPVEDRMDLLGSYLLRLSAEFQNIELQFKS